MTDEKRALLRHTVATLAYRGGKTLRGAPAGFETFQAGPRTRTPAEILAHIGDLLEWCTSLGRGQQVYRESKPQPWEQETARFFACLAALDAFLASDAPLGDPPEKLLQGPIADALTHVGQIGLLRGLAGAPVKGENYYRARIETGRVGADQPTPVREF
jgi:hypothetical protein